MDKEKYMKDLWFKYKKTKNLSYLKEACENAPFLGILKWVKKFQNY